jgi:hypothetical protein
MLLSSMPVLIPSLLPLYWSLREGKLPTSPLTVRPPPAPLEMKLGSM